MMPSRLSSGEEGKGGGGRERVSVYMLFCGREEERKREQLKRGSREKRKKGWEFGRTFALSIDPPSGEGEKKKGSRERHSWKGEEGKGITSCEPSFVLHCGN